ncbi:MAE_28990/MAE_18760 family HEPN-like nuclease [Bradyrhizobium sp.]|uniref:MAE_28990/MAE_18760 family HEPN-like nuclease n=1 Tax=Bradyrhizobium sp. TaxID=376 RepID=UPI002727234E|nr:MAE_28990/MAE_18760 family HEPN-like nuclease [Bradyrhizobium sp.]MDO9296995.1 MAE_28990/MAE_18760 family HEPN-like nuclease [Bradyrhizobium sp.]
MTGPLAVAFNERKRQARHYLSVVITAERMASLSAASKSQGRRLLTLRAGTFLLLYNIIEATTRNSIEAIHDKITTEQTPFDKLSQVLRQETIRRYKRNADDSTDHDWQDFPASFVAVALNEEIKLSGNVDARLIRSLGNAYGFSCHTNPTSTWKGSDLVTIKDIRNDLAHGLKTYEDVGKEYPAKELLAITRRSLSFMREITVNIDDFLDNKHYLR